MSKGSPTLESVEFKRQDQLYKTFFFFLFIFHTEINRRRIEYKSKVD